VGSYVQNESGYIAVYIFTLSLLLFPPFFVLLAILHTKNMKLADDVYLERNMISKYLTWTSHIPTHTVTLVLISLLCSEATMQ
jgi:hypothetical protein